LLNDRHSKYTPYKKFKVGHFIRRRTSAVLSTIFFRPYIDWDENFESNIYIKDSYVALRGLCDYPVLSTILDI